MKVPKHRPIATVLIVVMLLLGTLQPVEAMGFGSVHPLTWIGGVVHSVEGFFGHLFTPKHTSSAAKQPRDSTSPQMAAEPIGTTPTPTPKATPFVPAPLESDRPLPLVFGNGLLRISTFGDLFPVDGLAPALGTTIHPYSQLNLTRASIDSTGTMTLSGGLTVGGLSNGFLHADKSGKIATVQIDLGQDITSTLGVGNGGTGQTSFTRYGVLYGNGTSGIGALTPGSSGYVLQSNGTGAAPSWVAATGLSAGSVALSGITSGTNTTASMLVGSGASLGFSGAGTINASSLLGNTWAAPGTIGAGTANTGAFTTLTLTGLTSGSIPFIGASGVLSQDNANFFRDPSTGQLAIFDKSGTELLPGTGSLPQRFGLFTGTFAAPITTDGPVAKITKIENITAATQPNPADNSKNAALFIASQGLVTSTPQVNALNLIAVGGGTTAGADVAALNAVGWINNTGATGYGMGAYLEGRRDVTTGHDYGAEITSNNNVAQDGVYASGGASDTMGIWLPARSPGGYANAAGLQLGGLSGSQWLYGIAFNTGSVRTASLRDDSSAVTSYLINGSHTYGIDTNASTFTGAALRMGNNQYVAGRNVANTAEIALIGLDGNNKVSLNGGKFTVDGSGNVAAAGTLALSGATLLLPNAGAIQFKDTGGTAQTALQLGSDNVVRVGAQVALPSNGHLILYANGVEGARINPTGTLQLANGLLWGTDNTYDIGTNGASRPRNLYVASNALVAGNLGIGTTNPTGRLQIAAGSASTAPLLFTAGTNLTTPLAGAMEWDGTNLFITQTAGATRKTLAFTDSALIGSLGFDKLTTGTNTTATMTVGSGGSLTYTGTGTINASSLLGNTWAAPGAIGATTANTGAFTTLTTTGISTFGGNLALTTASEPNLTITNTAMSGSPSLFIGMNSGNNAAFFQATTGKDFKFYNGQYALTVLGSNGYVGVLNTNPGYPLQVTGRGRFDSLGVNSGTTDSIVNINGSDGSKPMINAFEDTGSIYPGNGGVRALQLGYNYNVTSGIAGGFSGGASLIYGSSLVGSPTIAPIGSPGGYGWTEYVNNSGNKDNEYSANFAEISFLGTADTLTTFPSATPGRGWITDYALQGPAQVRPSALAGVHSFVVNYYNGSPAGQNGLSADPPANALYDPHLSAWNGTTGTTNNPSASIIAGTGSGAGTSTHAASFPLDVGVQVVGQSGSAPSHTGGRGFDYGVVVGGVGSNWGVTTRVGTGLFIRDYDTLGIDITNPYTGAGGIQTAMAIEANAGSLVLGETAPAHSALLEVIGKGYFSDTLTAANSLTLPNTKQINGTDLDGNTIGMVTLTADNSVRVGTLSPTKSGGVTAGPDLYLVSEGAIGMQLSGATNPQAKFFGTVQWSADNSFDLGIASNRPRNLNLGSNAVIGGAASVSGILTVGNGTTNTIESAYGPLQLAYKSGANAWTTGITLQDTTGNVGIGQTNPTLGPLQMASGAYVTSGGVWTNASDRNLKTNFTPLDAQTILSKIDTLPVTEWNYKREDAGIKHIGPVAQDFYAAFGLGNNNTSISTIDPAGIALLGIQALDQKYSQLSQQATVGPAQPASPAVSTQSVTTLQTSLQSLEDRVTALEKQVPVQSAPISASLSAALTGVGLSTGNDATISGSLIVQGRTTLNDLGVTGNITAGVLSIHGLDGTIDALGNTLKLQSLGTGSIDLLAGKVTVDANGNVVAKGEITAKKLNIDESLCVKHFSPAPAA